MLNGNVLISVDVTISTESMMNPSSAVNSTSNFTLSPALTVGVSLTDILTGSCTGGSTGSGSGSSFFSAVTYTGMRNCTVSAMPEPV